MTTHTDVVLKTKKYIIMNFGDRLSLKMADDETTSLTEMSLSSPDDLSVQYTRTMLHPLAFIPAPTEIILIGLGGGQQAKFIHRHLPELQTIAVEIDPEVVGLARTCFGLPADDERLRVVVEDASTFIPNHGGRCDLILADAFDECNRPIDALHTAEFYRACHRILRADGVMTVNVYRPTANWAATFMSTVAGIFPRRKFIALTAEQGVMVLWKGRPNLNWDAIRARAATLDARTGLGFEAFVDTLSR
ncbi:methyltransferase domain-containing protein [Trinickia terrae]|uniref:Methyltransferase domain-containing protein n=1 Tax=Trinickia terrae TaxID=2571161 RepID=A0A4V5PJP6_9BURK|nr:fused MFS/spermidine synthase [Trinickia terrae]TKC92260.1 methyltransferase domain-containing protein [Trinickia terrae]